MAITIALADDHQLVRKGIRLLLENIKEFKVVSEAANGKELIDNIALLPKLPDLVLVDVNNPWQVSSSNLLYKCKWSPLFGFKLRTSCLITGVNTFLSNF